MQQTLIKKDPKHEKGCKHTAASVLLLCYHWNKKYFTAKRAAAEETELF